MMMMMKCDRESARRQTDTLTDANRFYNLSHAICYSYGTDNDGTNSTRMCACYCQL